VGGVTVRPSGRRLASGRLPRGAQDGIRARFRLDKPSMPEPCGSRAARRPPNLARHRRDRQRREGGYQQHGDGLQGPQPSTPPTPTLCVFTDNFFGPWIRINSSAEIVPLPDAMDGLIDYYRRISGEHPDWDDYRRHGGTATCAHPAVNRPRRPRPRRVAANSSPASLMTLCGPGRPVAHAVIGRRTCGAGPEPTSPARPGPTPPRGPDVTGLKP
jgi:hypothetical protein